MLLLRTDSLPDDPRWEYQLKLDGYRAVAFKSRGIVHLRSRNDKDFTTSYPSIVRGLQGLPDETVIDGEVVAFDEEGRPSFSALQNHGSATPLVFYVFDVMVLAGKDVMGESLERRRALLERKVLPKLTEPVRYTPPLDACNTYRATFDGLRQLELDMHQHVHKENNILFPKAARVEQLLTRNR